MGESDGRQRAFKVQTFITLPCPEVLRAWGAYLNKSWSKSRLWDLSGLSSKLCTAEYRLGRPLQNKKKEIQSQDGDREHVSGDVG